MRGAVWLVRSRQLLRRFRFWLAIFGYDRHDRSFTHKLYLVYAAIFFMAWGFAVLSLLAGQLAGLLIATGVLPLTLAATAISLLALLAWWFVAMYAASRRTPIPFSEEDAFLICQTPVSRRAVALAWFVGEWPSGALFFGSVAVALGFALMEASSAGHLSGADLPRYVLAGLRSLSLMLPLYAGLLAIQWAWGIYRLHGYQNKPGMRFVPLALAALLVAALVAANLQSVSGNWLVPLIVSPWMAVLWPVTFPLQAGYGALSWWAGMLAALGFAVVGLLLLAGSATRLNLSRAAQESRARPGSGPGLWFGNAHQAEEQRQRSRLGAGQASNRRPMKPGSGVILWKNRVRFSRLRLLSQLWPWISIFGLCLVVLLMADWGVRAWAILVWALLVGQRSTSALQNDLALWSIFRQLPLTAERVVWMDLLHPVILASLVAWGSLAIVAILNASLTLLGIAFIAPLLVFAVATSAAFDVLRQCRAADLLAGYAPQPGILALLISGVIILFAFLLAAWLGWFGLFLASALSLGSAFLLLHLAVDRLIRIH